MTDADQIAQSLAEAMQLLALLEEFLTDASDALWRLENQELIPDGQEVLSERSDADGSTACR